MEGGREEGIDRRIDKFKQREEGGGNDETTQGGTRHNQEMNKNIRTRCGGHSHNGTSA